MVLINWRKNLAQTQQPLHLSPYFKSNLSPNPRIAMIKAKFSVPNLYYSCIKHPKAIFTLFLKYVTA